MFMSLGYVLAPVHAMLPCPWDIPIHLHFGSELLVYNADRIENGDVFMSLGYVLVPVPGTCICHPCHAPGTHRYLYVLYLISMYIIAPRLRLEIFSNIFMTPGHVFVLFMLYVPSPWGIPIPLHSESKPLYIMASGLRLMNLSCPCDLY